jgi:sporulation protein YlmC with PRC-barrel domain
MVTASEHQNKRLISITNGKQLGEVRDLYLDADLTRVIAVQAGSEGFLSRQSLAIARPYIQVYGEDVWLVGGDDTVVPIESIADYNSFVTASSLRGREIQTEGGTRIATVEDVLLDAEARVLGFTLQRVFVQSPVAERKAIARTAIQDVGSEDRPMLADMVQAEGTVIDEA